MRRILIALLLWAVAAPALAVVVLPYNTNPPDSAGGYYIVVWNEDGEAWNGTAFATYTTTRDTWDLQATQTGTTGRYSRTLPQSMPAGLVNWSWFREASVGVRSHANDVEVATGGPMFWNGFEFSQNPDMFETIATVTSQTIFVITHSGNAILPERDDALDNYTVRVSKSNGGEDAGYVSSVRRVTAHDYDADLNQSTITIDSAADYTVTTGNPIEFYLPTVSAVLDELDEITQSGPIEHTAIPASRTLPVRSRGDGTFGVVGRLRMRPGETLWFAVDLRGTQLSAGDLVDGVTAPTVSGADSANLTVSSYGILGTLVKFKAVLSASADDEDVINVNISIAPETGETLKITIPVTVGS